MRTRESLLLLALVPLVFAVPAGAAAPTPTVTITVTATVTVPPPAPGSNSPLPAPSPPSSQPAGWLDRLDGKARPLALEAIAVFAAVVVGCAYAVMRPAARRRRKVDP